MTVYHYYVIAGGGYACYMLGIKHALGHKGWKNFGLVLLSCAAWPAMVPYGIWLAHFSTITKK